MSTDTATSLIDDLRAIVGAEGVLADPQEVRVYECDGFPIARGTPTAVVFPRDTEQVAACVKAVAAHDLPIIPRGSGTGLTGASVAYGEGVLITTTRMTKIEKIDVANRVAVVQAGVANLTLSQAVAATAGGEHLHYSPDPSSQRASTIGGNVATNAGGINTLKHGVTTNHILGVEHVLADGSIVRSRCDTLCDGMGPDLPGLVCGSEGTLGLVTRVWCRLVPKPQHFRTIYAVFNSSEDACRTVSQVIGAGIIPTSMEMMDGQMIQIVEDAFHYGFPTSAQALLLIEIDGVDLLLDEQLGQILEICRANKAFETKQCADARQRAELWSARKRAFGAIGRVSPSYCTQDACIPRSKLPEAMRRINEIGERHGLRLSSAFHAGDGNVHPILMFDEADPDDVQRVMHASEQILEYCISIGGTITGEHGVGVEKLHLMEKMFNPATIRLFKRLRRALDPEGRFNEGKLIPSDRLSIELVRPVSANVPGGAL